MLATFPACLSRRGRVYSPNSNVRITPCYTLLKLFWQPKRSYTCTEGLDQQSMAVGSAVCAPSRRVSAGVPDFLCAMTPVVLLRFPLV